MRNYSRPRAGIFLLSAKAFLYYQWIQIFVKVHNFDKVVGRTFISYNRSHFASDTYNWCAIPKAYRLFKRLQCDPDYKPLRVTCLIPNSRIYSGICQRLATKYNTIKKYHFPMPLFFGG